MRVLFTAALMLGSLSTIVSAGQFVVPRPAPEFVISYPGGKQELLSKYKGKVVALAFIFTTCPHCQVECQMLSKLNTELGAKGFQPLAVAANPMAIMLVNDFIKDYRVNFPVGATETGPLMNFMHINEGERWVVPQLAIIDRRGQIRAQTPFNGDVNLQEEAKVKALIESLLKEGVGPVRSGGAGGDAEEEDHVKRRGRIPVHLVPKPPL